MANILAFWSIDGAFFAVADKNPVFLLLHNRKQAALVSARRRSDYRTSFKHIRTLKLSEDDRAV